MSQNYPEGVTDDTIDIAYENAMRELAERFANQEQTRQGAIDELVTQMEMDELHDSLKRGLEQSANGETESLGDFSQYLED